MCHGNKGIGAVLLAAAVSSGGVLAQGSPSPQLGLRLSSEYSMQWNGGRLYLEGRSLDVLDTGAKAIYDVWPGSAPGSFSISYDEGVGLLLGTGIVPGGYAFGKGTLLRSGRVETICGAIVNRGKGGTTETRFVEWRTSDISRTLATVPGAVVDFDVDASTRVVYLLANRRLYLLADTHPPGVEVVLPKDFASKPERVFIDAQSTEIVVFGEGRVARLDIKSRKWNVQAFELHTQALVRHATSRRVRAETRFR
jgi:hypothetical protein